MQKLEEDSVVIIDMTRTEFIDKDILDTINEFNDHAHLKYIRVEIKNITYNDSSIIKSVAEPSIKTMLRINSTSLK